jgi:hypothetical protein
MPPEPHAPDTDREGKHLPQSVEPKPDLPRQIYNWLETEGYPLEFRIANMFLAAEVPAFQGEHVRDRHSGAVREIDVVAQWNVQSDDLLFRIAMVVECKWSRDKPWVVFAQRHRGMAPSACINQTIASRLGGAVMWMLASKKEVQDLAMFRHFERPGFGGRKAFSKGEDHFYNALQSVISASVSLVQSGDAPARHSPATMPDFGVIALPVIVVDGELFKAFYDSDQDDVRLERADWVRMHWKGAEAYTMISTVDIVRVEFFDQYLADRKRDIEHLLTSIDTAVNQLRRCYHEMALDALDLQPAARGTVGLPPLIADLRNVIIAQAPRIPTGAAQDPGVEQTPTP